MSFAEAIVREWRIATVAERRRLTEVRNVSEEEIERQLAEEGLIRIPTTEKQLIEEFRRIDVNGKPVSEMIIEERR
jgi:molecular chaperone DnaK (HSP70)